jgi:hypothetical protein
VHCSQQVIRRSGLCVTESSCAIIRGLFMDKQLVRLQETPDEVSLVVLRLSTARTSQLSCRFPKVKLLARCHCVYLPIWWTRCGLATALKSRGCFELCLAESTQSIALSTVYTRRTSMSCISGEMPLTIGKPTCFSNFS